MPWMWIVAGPNGSGKTSIVKKGIIQSQLSTRLMQINPDDIAIQIGNSQPSLNSNDVSLLAARQSDALVDKCIEERKSFLVETVLSSDKFKQRVDTARKNQFSIGLTFVVLVNADLSIERIKQRVALKGHDVPPELVRARWSRSVANLRWFALRADVVHVFDNSNMYGPVLIVEKSENNWTWHDRMRIPEVDASLSGL